MAEWKLKLILGCSADGNRERTWWVLRDRCDKRMSKKLKNKVYKKVVRPAMLYEAETNVSKKYKSG